MGGGIAAYKAPEIVRRLSAVGAEVQVAMTPAAREFITPLTLQTLSRRRVATDLLDAADDAEIGHIRLADEADVVLVAPATAGLIARMAAGMADDIVTCTLLATRAPVVVAPAMNTHMLTHPAVVGNLEKLLEYGYRVVESDSGELACGYEGRGRLPDPDVLLDELGRALEPQDMAGRRVLVSAGPTREPIDPVRYLSNRSSGRMGFALAAAARRRGAEVTLVSGPASIAAPRVERLIAVETAAEMTEAVLAEAASSDVVLMVAAVADYRPGAVAEQKIKKTGASLTVELEKTDDVLVRLAELPGRRVVVGFAAETESVESHALDKLRRKRLDFIVANDVAAEGCGFEVSTNAAVIFAADGSRECVPLMPKDALADRILDRVAADRAPNDG